MTLNRDIRLLGQGFYWQELHVNQKFRTYRRTVTETDLVNFISAIGMLEAVFIDADFEHAALADRPVPAMLSSGLIEGMLCQTMVQGTGLALLEMSIKAIKPVVVNDAIYGVVEVVEVRPTSKNNRAVLASRVDVFNQHDVNVLTYDVKRMLAGRPD
jgi:3-hydroxybutyryl-CoA dehydratase